MTALHASRATAARVSPLRLVALALIVFGLLASFAQTARAAGAALGDADGASPALAQDDPADGTASQVEILPLAGFIDPPVAAAIIDVIDRANDEDADLVVVLLDTVGGIKVDTDELVEAITLSEVPVAVLIGPQGARARAAGVGAFIAGAAHVVAVADDASFGPAAPADLGREPGEYPEADVLPRLYGTDVSAMLDGEVDAATARSLLAADPDRLVLPAGGLEPLLAELDGRTVLTIAGDQFLELDTISARFHSLGLVRRTLHAATTPALIYLLVVFGLGMLLFEAFQPGFGVAGIAGLIMVGVSVAGLAVLPVSWWGLALLVAGLLLYAVDTAMAGFGLVTVAATATFVLGSLNLYDSDRLGISGGLVAFMTAMVAGFFVVVMTIVLRAQAGPADLKVDHLVGKVGVVRSILNPEGHVFIDGALWRAQWTGEARRAKVGTTVRVHGVEGPTILVDVADVVDVTDGSPAGSDTV